MHVAARRAVLGSGSCAAFAAKFPLLWAIIEHDAARVAQLCDQGLRDVHAPGGLNPLHLCALLNFPSPVPLLVAAGVPLDAQLSQDYFSPPLAQWLRDARLGTDRWDGACRLRAGRTPLGVATSTHEGSYEAVGAALLDAGTDVWELLRQPPHHFFYAAWLAPALAQRLAAGQLVVQNTEQLGLLVRLAVVAAQAAEAVDHPSSAGRPCARAAAQAAACWDILQLVEQQQRMREEGGELCLGMEDAVLALVLGVQQGHAELVSWVLRRHRAASIPGSRAHNSVKHTGAVGNPYDWLPPHSQGAVVAAQRGHSQVLELLLEAGAVLTSALVHAVIRQSGGQPSLLASLLRWGPIPVDHRQPLLHQKYWTCPVLLLLQTNCEAQQGSAAVPTSFQRTALLLADMLVEAGCIPTVYKNVSLPPSSAPIAAFDPLKERRKDFDLDGVNRYLWLALQPEGWSPATHSKYPAAFKSSCRAVLLAAARCSRAHAQVQAALASGGGSLEEGSMLLGALPQELLLNILHQAARPLSAWEPA